MKQSQLIIVGLIVAALAAGAWYWSAEQRETEEQESTQTTQESDQAADDTETTEEIAVSSAVTFGQELRYLETEGSEDATGGSAASEIYKDELGNELMLNRMPGTDFYFGEMILVDADGDPVDFFYNYPGQEQLVLNTLVLGSGQKMFSSSPSGSSNVEDFYATPSALCSDDDIESLKSSAVAESTEADNQKFMEDSAPYTETAPEELFDPAQYDMMRGTITETEQSSASRLTLAMIEALEENPDSCVNQRAEVITQEEAQQIKESADL